MNVPYDRYSVADMATKCHINKYTLYKLIENNIVPSELIINVSGGIKKARWMISPEFAAWFDSYSIEKKELRKKSKTSKNTSKKEHVSAPQILDTSKFATTQDIECLLNLIQELENKTTTLQEEVNCLKNKLDKVGKLLSTT